MVNLLLASLVSACLGFLAGSMFSSRNESPLSKKEAVTGDVETPAKSYQIPRPQAGKEEVKTSAANSQSKPASPPQFCEPGITILEQLQRMKFLELRRLCDDAENEWMVRNVDNRFPFPEGSADKQAADFSKALRESGKQGTHWHAQSLITGAGLSIEVEVLFTIYPSNVQNKVPWEKLPTAREGDGICYAIELYFTVNGKLQSPGSMSSCDTIAAMKDGIYYHKWATFADKEIAPLVSVMMIPLPPADVGLDYLNATTGQWTAQSDYHWSTSTDQEFTSIRNRYTKKLEQQGR